MAVLAVEEGEIRIYLEDPIGLNEGDATNIDETASASQERPALHPRNDIVECPGCDERDDCGREKPAPSWRIEKDKEAIRESEYKLRGHYQHGTTTAWLNFQGSPTSSKISLWSRTPRRIFARVIPHMIIRAPTMKPCDHASRVSLPGTDGLAC